MRKRSVILMLLIVVSIVKTAVINHNEVYENNERSIEESEINSTVVSFEGNDQPHRSQRKRNSRSLSDMDSPNDHGYMNLYIRESCRDDRQSSHRSMRFPYAQYVRSQFPSFGSWIRVSRWMPIYVERITRQTLIHSSSGFYILPPLVNFYGKVFSVAELLAYGYATFLSTGAPMSPYFNIAYYANSGSYFRRGMPRFNPRAGGFANGVHSNYRSYFKPDCPNEYDENAGAEQSYRDESYEYQNQKNEYYNAPRHRTRQRHIYQSNVYILGLKKTR